MSYSKRLAAYSMQYHELLGYFAKGHMELPLEDLALAEAVDFRKKFYGFRSALLSASLEARRKKDLEASEEYERKYNLALGFELCISCAEHPTLNWTKLPKNARVTLLIRHKDMNPTGVKILQKIQAAALAAPQPISLEELLGPEAAESPFATMDRVVQDLFDLSPRSEDEAKG